MAQRHPPEGRKTLVRRGGLGRILRNREYFPPFGTKLTPWEPPLLLFLEAENEARRSGGSVALRGGQVYFSSFPIFLAYFASPLHRKMGRFIKLIPLREGNQDDAKFIDTLIAVRCLNILLKLSSPSFVRNALMLFPYYIPVSSRISIEYGGS